MSFPKLKDASKVFAITTTLLLLIYGWSVAPAITLMDSGDLITAAAGLGIAHPPGYPLFSILGFLTAKALWFLEPAYSINLLNALFGAMACGLLTVIIFRLTANKKLAVLGGLSLAFTSATWSLSCTTEVYTLNLLLNNLLWLLAIDLRRSFRPRKFYTLCLVLGLALANSYPLILLSGLGLIGLVRREFFRPRHLIRGFGFVLIGLSPYLYLFIQSQRMANIDYIFFDIASFEKVMAHILRSNYSLLDSRSSSLFEKWEVLLTLSLALIKDFALSIVWVAMGIHLAFKTKFDLRWPLLIAFLASSVLLFVLLGTSPDEILFDQFYEYILPSLTYLTMFAAIGLKNLLQSKKLSENRLAGLYALTVLTQAVHAYPIANNRGNRVVEAWATTLLNALPPDTRLILCGDEFPLQYLHTVKRLRPDTHLLVSYFDSGKPFLYERGPGVAESIDRHLGLEDLLATSTVPVHITDCAARYSSQGYRPVLKGLSYQLIGPQTVESMGLDLAQTSVESILDTLLLAPAPKDFWVERLQRRSATLLLTYAKHMRAIGDIRLNQLLGRYHLDGNTKFRGSIAAAFGYNGDFQRSLELFKSISEDQLKLTEPDDLSVYCRMLIILGDLEKAQNLCSVVDSLYRGCNADAKYNLGRAFWADKVKSIKYLTEASKCDPSVRVIKESLTKRQAE